MWNKRIDYPLCALFFFSMAYQFIFYRYGLNLWDEGVIYSGVARFLDGELINRDFYAYQPGRYYMLAFFFKWFGATIETGRLMWIPLTSLMAALTLVLSRRLMSGAWSWLPPLLLLAAPSYYYNRYFPLLIVVNLYFLYRLAERPHLKNLALSVFMASFTFFFSEEI